MHSQQKSLRPGLIVGSALSVLLSACGGQSGGTASAGGTSVIAGTSVIGALLDPLAPAGDLGGADAPASDYRSRSLYSGPGPRPGPALLYAAAPAAPQLENSGIWRAAPILVSGASAYRRGEFLYQDYLYDDRGAGGTVPDPADPRVSAETFSKASGTYRYPTDPSYAGNAADIVELRVKPQSAFTAFRVTLNSVLDAERVGFTIAIGDSAAPRPFPFGANVAAPAQYFLTVHGGSAVLTRASDGAVVGPAPTVTVDLARRQFEVRVPVSAWDPGDGVVRLAAGAGLWDAAAQRYLTPGPAASATMPGGSGTLLKPAAFFNVAFRYAEPMPTPAEIATGNSPWRDKAQAAALAAGDISAFYASVDFAKLKAGVNDDMPGQPQGVPQTGPINRIFASRVETRQGVDYTVKCGSAPDCKGEYRGQLQPYALYIPIKPLPAAGYGFTLLLHSLGGNHNQYLNSRNQSQLGERGVGHIVATALGRGPDGWYVEDAAADTFEMWADIARNYPLNPEMTSISGYSMGGHATYKFATRYPDLFARGHAVVGPPGVGIWAPPLPPTGGGEATNTYHLLPGLRNVPLMMWVQATDELVPYIGTRTQAERMDVLAYRYRFDTYTSGEHLTLALHDQFEGSAAFLGDAIVERNPAHVTYVVNPPMDVPGRGLVGDHAYWLSGIAVRDPAVSPRGTIDVFSRGFGVGDPAPSATRSGAGVSAGNLGLQAYVSQYKTWGLPPPAPVANQLDIVARNVGAVTVDVKRAKVSCDAVLAVDSDGPLTVTLQGCNRQLRF
jgi:hypothetical protein